MAQAIEFASKTKPRFCFATMKNSMGEGKRLRSAASCAVPSAAELRLVAGLEFFKA